MKVIDPKTMLHIESLAYQDGASEETFMEEAGRGIAGMIDAFTTKHALKKNVLLVCGKGNNGGDTYVAGIHLISKGYNVSAYQTVPPETCSPLCQKNHKRFLTVNGNIIPWTDPRTLHFPDAGLIVDGIFGTGFHGRVEEPYASFIDSINASGLPIISVDIPSGLNGTTGDVEDTAVKSTATAFLGLPKTGFFLKQGWNHVGRLFYVDFSLANTYIDQVESDISLITDVMAAAWMPHVERNRHKYQAGHVVGLAGSPNFPGAALLSSFAALRSGAGIVHLLYPDGMQAELANAPFELIKIPYQNDHIETILDLMKKALAVFVGPGLGREPATRQLLKTLLPQINKPCVIDADALTIIAEEKIPLPANTVLTPHMGEMHRLFSDTSHPILNLDYLNRCQAFAEKNNATLVLKRGAFVYFPSRITHFNQCHRKSRHGNSRQRRCANRRHHGPIGTRIGKSGGSCFRRLSTWTRRRLCFPDTRRAQPDCFRHHQPPRQRFPKNN